MSVVGTFSKATERLKTNKAVEYRCKNLGVKIRTLTFCFAMLHYRIQTPTQFAIELMNEIATEIEEC